VSYSTSLPDGSPCMNSRRYLVGAFLPRRIVGCVQRAEVDDVRGGVSTG
jgi:hypothetical protein